MVALSFFLGMLGPWQIVLIVVVVLLLFGGKKIPELMRGLGSGIKEFKDASNPNDVEDITELNRKERTKMSKTKEGQKVSQVIIQEGVYTHETWGNNDTVAEPVVYMIDHQVVGGFYRVHEKRSSSQNLNAPGMRFEPLAFDECCNKPDLSQDIDCHQNRFYTYGVIARLALLAAAREIKAIH